jgi:hypothetical protein
MLELIPGLVLFVFCVYSFFREVRLDHKRRLEQDRLGDEHIMREIDRFLREKKASQELASERQDPKQF